MMRKIDKDQEGFVFSLDLLLALIPLTILLGMAAADMDAMFYLTQEGVYQTSLERVGRDTVSALLETSGTPINWEETGNPTVIGLAKYDDRKDAPIENDLSPTKLGAMNVTNMQELIGEEYGYFINITTVDTNHTYYTLGSYDASQENIARIERLVQLAKFEVVSDGTGVRNTGAPRDFSSPPDPFKTNFAINEKYDHYVLVYNRRISSASVVINDQTVIGQQDFNPQVTFIRRKIDREILKDEVDLLDNSVVLRQVASRPGQDFDVYIVRVPKGTPEDLVTPEDARPILGRFVLYIWVR